MGKQFEELAPKHIDFIKKQKIYFVGTAAQSGHVNISPKGGDTLRVIDNNTIAWLNLTGSGNETAPHLYNTNRMTIMFCAFEGAPMILRTYGPAKVLHQGDDAWHNYIDLFEPSVASRQIYVQSIELVQTSCGMSVPYFDYQNDRDDLANWSIKQGKAGIDKYWAKKNQHSIDGFETEILSRSSLTEPVTEE
ncbi:pyridoxamine 5'-phosphate oxidase family protein [Catenovulum sp. SM1970]|uniref:pyridoxamine 5'-phosphate oxidase family protein n=1 Tax=Marinifaba aquimaris TaxID=2741323 RepID=UPI001574C32C|nr:pyridoxamine 5'-phosphate oxidase family protein [Marinifaba aquimaris]NTS77040.1 pyridoxamine 5'-phosphate oxidase family protein [Marinifaba aquimaris]